MSEPIPADPVERAYWHLAIDGPVLLSQLEDEIDERFDDEDEYEERDLTCRHCSGTGGDRWNDGITPCEHCDGEGYEWWQ